LFLFCFGFVFVLFRSSGVGERRDKNGGGVAVRCLGDPLSPSFVIRVFLESITTTAHLVHANPMIPAASRSLKRLSARHCRRCRCPALASSSFASFAEQSDRDDAPMVVGRAVASVWLGAADRVEPVAEADTEADSMSWIESLPRGASR
jgi:hypothetical protein